MQTDTWVIWLNKKVKPINSINSGKKLKKPLIKTVNRKQYVSLGYRVTKYL